jgi:hypothetical protein
LARRVSTIFLQRHDPRQPVDPPRVVADQRLQRRHFHRQARLGQLIGVQVVVIAGQQVATQAGFHVDRQPDRFVGIVDDPIGVLHPIDDRHQVNDDPDEHYAAQQPHTQGQTDIAGQQFAKALLVDRGTCAHIHWPGW